jgi:hypothetical protein
MADTPTAGRLGTWVFLVLGVLVAVLLLGLTINAKVARGEAWLPWVILLGVNAAVVTAVILVLQRAKNGEATRKTIKRWTLVVGWV